ncbi:MAG: hypothetical protein Kow00129_03930 [Thermoleophilia bacterium]
MSTAGKIIAGLVVLVVLVYVLSVFLVFLLAGDGLDLSGGSGTVAVLRLDGVVASDSSDPAFGGGGIDPVRTVRLLDEADSDESVDAVVLRVNSPGGSPAASWEIYNRLRGMTKPTVVSVGDVAASGAYYFACGADHIVAAPTASVGSIGVLLEAVNLEELFEKLGIRYTVLTKGKYKDLGNPARDLTAEEREILTQRLDEVYEQFIADVAAGRNLPEEEVRELANGLTYHGAEAADLGLIDLVGGYGDALDLAAESAGLDVEDYEVRPIGEDEYGFDLLSLLLGLSVEDLAQSIREAVAEGLRSGLKAPSGLEFR